MHNNMLGDSMTTKNSRTRQLHKLVSFFREHNVGFDLYEKDKLIILRENHVVIKNIELGQTIWLMSLQKPYYQFSIIKKKTTIKIGQIKLKHVDVNIEFLPNIVFNLQTGELMTKEIPVRGYSITFIF